MTWGEAKTIMARGGRVRRADWDNALHMNKGNIEFVTAVQIYGNHKDASYDLIEKDELALDWVRA